VSGCFLLISYDLHFVPVIRHVLAAVQTDNVGSCLARHASAVTNWLESPGKTVIGVGTTEEGVDQLGEHSELQWNEIAGAYSNPITPATRFCNLGVPPSQKTAHRRRGRSREMVYLPSLRRISAPTPRRPVPNKTILLGSGTLQGYKQEAGASRNANRAP
jgi:hypothetical protein